MSETFRLARAEGAKGIVLAMHADAGLGREPDVYPGYEDFADRLEDLVRGFDGQVLLIHGDDHELHVDHPLRDRATGQVLENFTRLETFGSPDIGWIRVVVDTIAGRISDYEPRLLRGWGPW
jgi:LmbE family N-acetylglucosaminyl deacetylase